MNYSSHVKFLPWKGKLYESGFRGVKTLILGESHYQKDGKAFSRKLNIDLITGQADKTGKYLGRYAFWTKIIRLLSPNDSDPQRFWHSVAYYNYIQEFVGGTARQRPTKEMWKDAKAPFFNVLKNLQPDFILVLGNHLWNNLPDDDCADIGDECSRFYCKYTVDGHSIIAAKTQHPSSFGLQYSEWQPVIARGIAITRRCKRPMRN